MNVQESSSEIGFTAVKASHVMTVRDFLSHFETLKPGDEIKSAVFSVEATCGSTLPFQLFLKKNKKDGVFLRNNQTKLPVFVTFSVGIRKSDQTLWQFGSIGQIHEMQKDWGWAKGLNKNNLLAQQDTLLPGGCLTLVCNLTVLPTKCTVTSESPIRKAIADAPRLLDSVTKLLSDPVLADITLICDNDKIPCHKAVLGARSDYFLTLFRQKDTLELKTNEVVIKDMKPDVLKMVVQVMYTDDYAKAVTKGDARDLLQAADRLMFPLLKAGCEEAIIKDLSVENAASVLSFAVSNNAGLLRSAAARIVRANAEKVLGTAEFAALITAHPEILVSELE